MDCIKRFDKDVKIMATSEPKLIHDSPEYKKHEPQEPGLILGFLTGSAA